MLILSIFVFSTLISYSQIQKNYLISQGYSLYGESIAPSDNHCCLLVCTADSSMNYQEGFIEPLYIFKVDQFGDSLWMRTIEISNLKSVHKIRKTDSGDYIILAESHSSQIVLIRINAEGEKIWEKRFNALYDIGFWVMDLIVANNGDYLITGWDLDSDYMMRPYLLRTNKEGNQLWYRDDYTADLIDVSSRSLVEDADNNIYLAGHLDPLTGGGSWDHDVCITKTDSDGNLIWQKTFDGPLNMNQPDYAENIIISSDHHLLITGQSYVDGMGYVTHFFKIDLDGNVLQKEQYSNGEINGLSIKESNDHSLYIAGRGFDPSLSDSYVNSIIKLNKNGQLIWSQFYANYTAINDYTIVRGDAKDIYLFSDEKWMSVGDITFGESLEIDGSYIAPHSLYIITPDINLSSHSTIALSKEVEVFPNPCHELLNIIFTDAKAGEVQLIDIHGRICKQLVVGSDIKKLVWNISDLKPGVYVLKTIMGKDIQLKKVLIQ